VESQPATGSQ